MKSFLTKAFGDPMAVAKHSMQTELDGPTEQAIRPWPSRELIVNAVC
jgi:hypothetical protein